MTLPAAQDGEMAPRLRVQGLEEAEEHRVRGPRFESVEMIGGWGGELRGIFTPGERETARPPSNTRLVGVYSQLKSPNCG